MCQQQPSVKKSFRFTKTKPVVMNLERYLTPEKEEQPDVVICDEVNSSRDVDYSKENGMENEAGTCTCTSYLLYRQIPPVNFSLD